MAPQHRRSGSQQHNQHQQILPQNQDHPQQTPARPGKISEDDPLPIGYIDPMATKSANLPLGYHSMRKHLPGMTHLDAQSATINR
jgi:hypothetical protein